jgi:hypothetical protein
MSGITIGTKRTWGASIPADCEDKPSGGDPQLSSGPKVDSAGLLLTGTACTLGTTPATIPLAVLRIGIAIPRKGFPILLRKLTFGACLISHDILLSFYSVSKSVSKLLAGYLPHE